MPIRAQRGPEAPTPANERRALERPREIVRFAPLVGRRRIVPCLVEAPLAVDVLDLVELRVRRCGELRVVGVLPRRVPRANQLERRFVGLEVALADVPVRDGMKVAPAV